MRETSLEAYQTIKEQGLLSRKRMEIYDILFREGPLTDQEVATRMVGAGGNQANGTNSHARIHELKTMGCVKEIGVKKSSVTGMTVAVYDVTGDLPRKIEKKGCKDTRSHLLKCKDVLREVFTHKELPDHIRMMIRAKFN